MGAQPIPAGDPAAAVRHYIDAFNNGDAKAMAACFAAAGSILDGLAPHVWHGPTACEDWYRDVLVAAKHEGAADFDSDWTGTGSHRDLLTIEASKDEAIEQFRIGAPLILENADGNLLAQSK
ncbi:MAG: hypothetical protein JO108_22050 [Acidobacteriaceae bacterium]|nr:hypothetical protein [Acidobacteriaceae bacterium]